MSLFERYRPTTLDAVVGQSSAVNLIRRLESSGSLTGRAYWIAGPTGTGKTTIARILASLVADDFSIDEIDAGGLSAARIVELERGLQPIGMSKPGRVVIVNEAHRLTPAAVAQLLTTLERLPRHVVWIFTTTDDGAELLFDKMDGAPLVSRCLPVPMARRGLCEAFAVRAQAIAQAEGLDGKPIGAYERLAKDCRNSFRAMLSRIEAGVMLA